MEIIVTFLLSAGAVFASADTTDTLSATLVGPTWIWVESVDADSSVYAPDSATAGHTFRFMEKGRFEEQHPGGCCDYVGAWSLTGTTLALRYTDKRRAGDFVRYEILYLSPDELVLGVRGRHGVVREYFAAQSPE